jgi:hypothetical protein
MFFNIDDSMSDFKFAFEPYVNEVRDLKKMQVCHENSKCYFKSNDSST